MNGGGLSIKMLSWNRRPGPRRLVRARPRGQGRLSPQD